MSTYSTALTAQAPDHSVPFPTGISKVLADFMRQKGLSEQWLALEWYNSATAHDVLAGRPVSVHDLVRILNVPGLKLKPTVDTTEVLKEKMCWRGQIVEAFIVDFFGPELGSAMQRDLLAWLCNNHKQQEETPIAA